MTLECQCQNGMVGTTYCPVHGDVKYLLVTREMAAAFVQNIAIAYSEGLSMEEEVDVSWCLEIMKHWPDVFKGHDHIPVVRKALDQTDGGKQSDSFKLLPPRGNA